MASRVAEALEICAKKQDFDVAICDVQLPDGDGVHLLRRLHQLNPQLFVLIITAYATVENAVEAFTAGAYDYFTKPVMFEDLVEQAGTAVSVSRTVFLENQGTAPRTCSSVISSKKSSAPAKHLEELHDDDSKDRHH